MQTYLVYHLLRTNTGRVGLLFCLLLLVCPKIFAAENLESHSKDSLYSQWAKSKSTLPTLFYELSDFNDYDERVEVESLIRMYGIGGVVISNGEQFHLKKWLSINQNWRKEPLLHVAKIDQIFELPFSDLQDYPSQSVVECWAEDSLVYLLGQSHAIDLKQMGFSMAQFSDLPDYYSTHEMMKVELYLKGFASQDMTYIFGENFNLLPKNRNRFKIPKSEIVNLSQITPQVELAKNEIKDYRKDTKDKRIIWTYATNEKTSIEQVERGLGLLVLPKNSKPQTLINTMLVEGIPTQKYYKGQVKKYYNLLQKTYAKETIKNNGIWQNLHIDAIENSITLIQDPHSVLPLSQLNSREIYVHSKDSNLKERVDKFKRSRIIPSKWNEMSLDSMVSILPANALVIADLSDLNIDELKTQLAYFDTLNSFRPVVLIMQGNKDFLLNSNIKSAVLWSPEESNSLRPLMLEMIFGGHAIKGKLPGYFDEKGTRRGIQLEPIRRLTYLKDKESDIDQNVLSLIDTLVFQAIKESMMPGCQIMMVKNGKVVYDKAFGHLTYDSLTPVRWDHVYDIASVTKTVATVPALMESVDQGRLKINGLLGDYLPQIDSTKARLELSDVLTHQSGLKSYIPFWRYAEYVTDSGSFLYKERIRRNHYKYHAVNWADSIQSWIGTSKYNSLSNQDGTYRYLYSDLGFMLMKDLVEKDCECQFDERLNEKIYEPLGMDLTTFNPLNKFSKEQIAPTEQDDFFRSDLLQGVVHDKNAALLGGVSGHAGLFSNANDLAKYMQMLIQKGYYGGVQYFSDSVVNVFTSKKNENDRRAMGWDKPFESVGNASKYASELSYGHSGFTGTLVWADPKYELVYIFLSNRIYPDPQNYKLIQSNIRTKIHDLMYESFINLEPKTNPGS